MEELQSCELKDLQSLLEELDSKLRDSGEIGKAWKVHEAGSLILTGENNTLINDIKVGVEWQSLQIDCAASRHSTAVEMSTLCRWS